MHKIGIIAGMLVVMNAGIVGPANAVSCNGRAANCVKNGGVKEECYAASRLAECKKTGLYPAPAGRVWDANLKCVAGPCSSYRGR